MLVNDEDEALLARARLGDELAFAALYHAHKGRVMSVLCGLTRSMEDAEDLLQLTFWSAFTGMAGFRGECLFSSWLYEIAKNHWRMGYRRVKRIEAVTVSMDAAVDGDWLMWRPYGERDEKLESCAVRIDLVRRIAKLPQGYRRVLVLHVQGYKHWEIGKKLGCTVGTSGSQLSKARKELRRTMTEAVL